MSAQFAGAPAADEARARRGEFIQNNLGLVHCCAGRFRGRGIEYEDLYAAGCLGLVKACDGFDPSRGLCFSTYAVPVILGEIKKLFRDGGTVKVSRSPDNSGGFRRRSVIIEDQLPVGKRLFHDGAHRFCKLLLFRIVSPDDHADLHITHYASLPDRHAS